MVLANQDTSAQTDKLEIHVFVIFLIDQLEQLQVKSAWLVRQKSFLEPKNLPSRLLSLNLCVIT